MNKCQICKTAYVNIGNCCLPCRQMLAEKPVGELIDMLTAEMKRTEELERRTGPQTRMPENIYVTPAKPPEMTDA